MTHWFDSMVERITTAELHDRNPVDTNGKKQTSVTVAQYELPEGRLADMVHHMCHNEPPMTAQEVALLDRDHPSVVVFIDFILDMTQGQEPWGVTALEICHLAAKHDFEGAGIRIRNMLLTTDFGLELGVRSPGLTRLCEELETKRICTNLSLPDLPEVLETLRALDEVKLETILYAAGLDGSTASWIVDSGTIPEELLHEITAILLAQLDEYHELLVADWYSLRAWSASWLSQPNYNTMIQTSPNPYQSDEAYAKTAKRAAKDVDKNRRDNHNEAIKQATEGSIRRTVPNVIKNYTGKWVNLSEKSELDPGDARTRVEVKINRRAVIAHSRRVLKDKANRHEILAFYQLGDIVLIPGNDVEDYELDLVRRHGAAGALQVTRTARPGNPGALEYNGGHDEKLLRTGLARITQKSLSKDESLSVGNSVGNFHEDLQKTFDLLETTTRAQPEDAVHAEPFSDSDRDEASRPIKN